MGDGGWIRLYRNILEDELYKNCTKEQKLIMITLLLMANHREKEFIFDGKKVLCKPGQFVTSTQRIGKYVGDDISNMQIRRCIDKLEKYGFLINKPTNKARLITIVNWGKYQGNEVMTDQQPTSNRLANDQQPTTNKNERNKELYNDISKDISLSDADEDFTVSTQLDSVRNDVERVVAVWNESGRFRQISKVSSSSKRGKMLVARIREYGIEKVIECINTASKSTFLVGSEFFTIDWFVKPNNFIKVLEGNYNDRGDNDGGNRFSGMVGRDEEGKESKWTKYGNLYSNKK